MGLEMVADRPRLRQVALPSEHGGWGLTLEPGLLGVLLAPSWAGALLAVAALGAFVARTPLKVALVDRYRGRSLPRTVLARQVLGLELAVLAVVVAAAAWLAEGSFWWPALVAAPLVVAELSFDVRSRSRRLVPELAGSVGIASVVAMVVLAGGGAAALAVGAWLVLAGRALTSIPFVRAQVARIHGRPVERRGLAAADAAALVAAAAAVLVERQLFAGALAVVGVVVAQRISAIGPPPRAAVLGARQLAFGLAVVAVAALGVAAP